MFMHDITVECELDDVHKLRYWEEDALKLVLFREGGDEWKTITLERSGRTTWAQPFGYLCVPEEGSSLWLTITSESGHGIAHATIPSDQFKDSNEEGQACLDVEKCRLSLTLRWKLSMETPKGLLSTEVVHNASLMGYASYIDRRGVEAQAESAITALPYIEVSIPAWKRGAEEGDDASPEFAGCLQSLADALHVRFNHLGDPKDLDDAIEALERCVNATPDGHEGLTDRLCKLGEILDIRYGYRDTPDDLNRSIFMFKRALDLLEPTQSTFRTKVLCHIGWGYKRRWARTETVSDIEKAVSTFQLALESMLQDYPERASVLGALGSALQAVGTATDNIIEITASISILREAISTTPETEISHATLLRSLAIALEDRFSRNEDLEDIQEAIAAAQKAVDLGMRNGTPLTSSLSILSECLKHRAQYTGEKLDTTSTLDIMEAEVSKIDERDPDLPVALKHLGDVTLRQFQLDGDQFYLDKAIHSYRRAIDLSPSGQPNSALPETYNSLSTAYLAKYKITQDRERLDDAVLAIRTATELLSQGHGDLPPFLNCLQMTLQVRFETTESLDDIDDAIQAGHRAVEVAPPGHAALHLWWDQLGRSYNLRFEKTNEVADLHEAVSAKERALSLLPPDSIAVPLRQRIVADYYVRKHKITQNQSDLHIAVNHYRKSALAPAGYTDSRLHSARSWGKYARAFDTQSALEAYDRAIGLEQTQARRHEHIEAISDLSVSAAATACEAGDLEKALQWLEEGRCLVWGQLNDLRTPLEDLRSVDSALAERISTVAKALEVSGAGDGKTRIDVAIQSADGNDDAARGKPVEGGHVNLSMEWKRQVSEIRAKPGFEDFLQARSAESILQNLPSNGTIVLINIHSSRCDALALRSGWEKPMHIPLPKFSSAKGRTMSKQLREHLGLGGVRLRGYDDNGHVPEEVEGERALRRMGQGTAKYKLVDTLRELWASVVKPILGAIGYLEDNTSPQHLWWCPTGPLSFLPLHAAGAYKGGRDTAGDFAMSSYIPNVSILIKQMTRPPSAKALVNSDSTSGVFVISQPNTPNHTPLPGTTLEVKAVQGVFEREEIGYVHFKGEQATQDASLEQMALYSNVHFACHAYQDPKESLASGFFLQDGRLQLSQTIKNNLRDAELAFLSACQTSTGDEKLSEEAVHLAAGMVAAGYRGVIATMWSICDLYAPEIAVSFYTELLRLNSGRGVAGIGAQDAAEALHYAVGVLRTKLGDREDALLTWVPYVHFGI